MLDSKMTSLSPTTPISIHSEFYGVWDHENMSSSIVTKLESTDIMEFIEPSLTSPTTTLDTSGVLTLQNQSNHGHNRSDYGYHNNTSQQYMNHLGGDPYSSPSECHILENFHCIDYPFQKLSDSSSFSDNYDNFIPDLTQNNNNLTNSHESQDIGRINLSGGHLQTISVPIPTSTSYLIHEPGGVISTGLPSHQEYNMWDGFNYDQGIEYPFLKGGSPTTSDSIMSYTDIDSEIDSKSSRESISTFTEISRNCSPPKRRVGRPPKKDKKLKRAAEKKTGRLWEFIRDLLKNPDYCPSLVRWENPEEGHFRFVNSEKVAQLWGQIKGNPRMTYEKLSRAMRYYYKSHVFEPVLGRRLVYKFGYNATNWRPNNPNFVKNLYN